MAAPPPAPALYFQLLIGVQIPGNAGRGSKDRPMRFIRWRRGAAEASVRFDKRLSDGTYQRGKHFTVQSGCASVRDVVLAHLEDDGYSGVAVLRRQRGRHSEDLLVALPRGGSGGDFPVPSTVQLFDEGRDGYAGEPVDLCPTDVLLTAPEVIRGFARGVSTLSSTAAVEMPEEDDVVDDCTVIVVYLSMDEKR